MYYTADNNSAFSDATGNFGNATVSGPTYTASGKINGGYAFSNAAHYINAGCADAGVFANGGITFNAWVYMNSIGGKRVAESRNVSGKVHYQIDTVSAGSKYTFYSSDSSGKVLSTSADGYCVTGAWTMVTWVINGTTGKGYINGTERCSVTTAGFDSNTFGTMNYNVLGNENGHVSGMDGTLDEVGLWNRALTPTEITTLYQSGSGLQYPFNTGWSKKILGVTPAKINGVSISSISKVNGV